jgi:hypothetical protein
MAIRKFSTASISAGSNKSTKLWDQETFQSGMFALATVSLTSTASSISFSGISSAYTHLELRGVVYGSNIDENVRLRFNSDTANNYSRHSLNSNNTSTPLAYTTTPESYIGIGGVGDTTYGYATTNQILDYASVTKNKTVRSLNGSDRNGSGYVSLMSGHWRNSADAISTITISPTAGTFAANTFFALYGIKVA